MDLVSVYCYGLTPSLILPQPRSIWNTVFYHYGFVNLGPTVSDVIKLTFSWRYRIFLPASLWMQLLFVLSPAHVALVFP